MIPRLWIDAALKADMRTVARNLRPEHRRELAWLAGTGESDGEIRSLIVRTLAAADLLLVMRAPAAGPAVALIGIEKARLLSDWGTVWLLATEEIDQYAIAAALTLRELFNGSAHELAEARILEQVIPTWYAKGRKWLKWLGWRERGGVKVNGRPCVVVRHEVETIPVCRTAETDERPEYDP
jgi:hypothetical protein